MEFKKGALLVPASKGVLALSKYKTAIGNMAPVALFDMSCLQKCKELISIMS